MKKDKNVTVKLERITIYGQYPHLIIEYQIQYVLEIYIFCYRLLFELSYEGTTL